MVQLLLERPEIDVNILFKETHKYECTESRDEIDPFDYIQKTALYIALQNSNAEIINLLLDYPKIDVNILCKNWSFNFDKYQEWDLLELKRKDYKGKDDFYCKEENAALHIAVENGYIEIVNKLIENPNLDINLTSLKLTNDEEYKNMTALHIATDKNNCIIANLLLLKDDINTNILCYSRNDYWINEEAALHRAVYNKNIDILKSIISKPGTDLNIMYKLESGPENSDYKKEEKSALHIAVEIKNAEIVQLLSKNQSIDVNISMYEKSINSFFNIEEKEKKPLHLAVETRNIEIIRILLSTPNIDLNSTLQYIENTGVEINESERTALLIAIQKENTEIVKLLLSYPGIDINHFFADDSDYWKREATALHIAVSRNYVEIVKALLGYTGIDINAINKIQSTSKNESFKFNITEQVALHLAAENENLDIIKLLLEKNASIVNTAMSCSEYYCEQDEYLREIKGKTALHIAIEKRNHEIVQFLINIPQINLKAVYKINYPNNNYLVNDEKTPIIMSIKNKDPKIFNLLLSTKMFDVNKKFINKYPNKPWETEETILSVAVKEDCPEIVQTLLAQPGIDVNIVYKSSSTPSNKTYKY